MSIDKGISIGHKVAGAVHSVAHKVGEVAHKVGDVAGKVAGYVDKGATALAGVRLQTDARGIKWPGSRWPGTRICLSAGLATYNHGLRS